MAKKLIGALLIVVGAIFAITFQRWGFRLISFIGPARALGEHNVQIQPEAGRATSIISPLSPPDFAVARGD